METYIIWSVSHRQIKGNLVAFHRNFESLCKWPRGPELWEVLAKCFDNKGLRTGGFGEMCG